MNGLAPRPLGSFRCREEIIWLTTCSGGGLSAHFAGKTPGPALSLFALIVICITRIHRQIRIIGRLLSRSRCRQVGREVKVRSADSWKCGVTRGASLLYSNEKRRAVRPLRDRR